MNIKSIIKRIALAAAIAALATSTALLCGCEDDGDGHGHSVEPHAEQSHASSSSGNLSGNWSGVSGTMHAGTSLSMNDDNGRLSGRWTWSWGGERTFTGSRSGDHVTLRANGDEADRWELTITDGGNRLTGTGYKRSGGTYSVDIAR